MSVNHEELLVTIPEVSNRDLLPSLNVAMHTAAEQLQDGAVPSVTEFHRLRGLADGLTERPDGHYGRPERADGYRGRIVDAEAAEPVIEAAKPEHYVMAPEKVDKAREALMAKHLGEVPDEFRAGGGRLDTNLFDVKRGVNAQLQLHEAAEELIHQQEAIARAEQQAKNDAVMAEERRRVSEASMANAERGVDRYVSEGLARERADRASRGYKPLNGVSEATVGAALRREYMAMAETRAEQTANEREQLIHMNGGAEKLPAIRMKEQFGVKLKQPAAADKDSEAGKPEVERPSHATEAQWLRLSPFDKERVAAGAPVPERKKGKLGGRANPEPGQSRYDLIKPDDMTFREWYELSQTSARIEVIKDSRQKKAAAIAASAAIANTAATEPNPADIGSAVAGGRIRFAHGDPDDHDGGDADIDGLLNGGNAQVDDPDAGIASGERKRWIRRGRNAAVAALGAFALVAFVAIETRSPGTIAHVANVMPLTPGKGGGAVAHAHTALSARVPGATGGRIPGFEQAPVSPGPLPPSGAGNGATITETLAPGSNPWGESVNALHAQGVANPTDKQILELDNQAGAHLFKQLGLKFSQSALFDKARHLSVGVKLYFPRLQK